MWDWFTELDPAIQATIISAVVGSISAVGVTWLGYVFDRFGVEHRLSTQYEFEQRKALRDVAARHQGRLVEVAERLNHRLWNLLKNEGEGWLGVAGRYGRPTDYYFNSTVLRYLSFMALARKFEQEALCLDASIAKERELMLLKYAKACHWAAVDVYLFDGLHYDAFHPTDHFFRDLLAVECDALLQDRGGTPPGLDQFLGMVNQKGAPFSTTFEFFDGLQQKEERYRWDRVLVLHLLVMSFLNEFGYDMQHSNVDQFIYVSERINNREVLQNLKFWIPKLGLDDAGGTSQLRTALASVRDPDDMRGPNAWMINLGEDA